MALEENENLINEELEDGAMGYVIPDADELIELIRNKNYQMLRKVTADVPVNDLAEILNGFPERLSNLFFRLLPK